MTGRAVREPPPWVSCRCQLNPIGTLQRFAACSSHLFTIFTVSACVNNFYAARCGETFYIILSTWCHKASGDTFPCLVHLCCSLEKPGMQVKNVTFQWTLWGTSSSVRKLFVSTLCWYKLPWYKLGYCFYSEIFHLGQRTYAINKSCVEFCIRILPAFLRELRMFWSYRTWSYTVSLSLHGPTCGRRTKL
jgi:hypothetical protein